VEHHRAVTGKPPVLRQQRRRRDAKLTEQQVAAAFTVYEHTGMTMQALARLLAPRYGFASVHSCHVALHAAFIAHGFESRRVQRQRARTRHA